MVGRTFGTVKQACFHFLKLAKPIVASIDRTMRISHSDNDQLSRLNVVY
jgi:hypothetical protein